MATDIRIPIPITACPRCWRSYTLAEWRQLTEAPAELGDDADPPDWEHRLCQCGDRVTLDVSDLDDLDLTADILGYQADFPNSTRPGVALTWLAARRAKRVRFLCRLALGAFLAASLLLAYTIARGWWG